MQAANARSLKNVNRAVAVLEVVNAVSENASTPTAASSLCGAHAEQSLHFLAMQGGAQERAPAEAISNGCNNHAQQA